ncbi:MAG: alanine--tRNA ligase, partial [Burkholderiales bacterium]|nr:alanine--tRNA ligase [Anaerolineae bacterium]
ALQEELNANQKEITRLRRELARYSFGELISRMQDINGVPTLIAQLDGVPVDTLREMSDWFRNAVDSGVAVLSGVVDGRPQVVVAVTDDLTKKGFHAGNLVKQIAAVVGGGGGGRPTMAQAGGKDADKLPEAMTTAYDLIAAASNNNK